MRVSSLMELFVIGKFYREHSLRDCYENGDVCTRQINLKITEIVMFDIVHVS